MDEIAALREELQGKFPRYRHWEILKMLETDLANVSRYINITENNYTTHSAELSALILRICTEIEMLRKRMTAANDNGTAARKLFSIYPEIVDFEVILPIWSLSFFPWRALPDRKPEWWSAYEDIKHNTSNALAAGNLYNFLSSFAGLYCLMLFYDRLLFGRVNDKGIEYVLWESEGIASIYFYPDRNKAEFGKSWNLEPGIWWKVTTGDENNI